MAQLIKALCKNRVFGNCLKTEPHRFIPTLTASFSESETNVSLPFLSSRRYCVKSASNPVTDDESGPYYVYVGTFTTQLRRVKLFSFTTSVIGISAQPALMDSTSSIPLLVAGSTLIAFFTLVTPILLHLVARRYVIDIVYDKSQDTYTANMMTFFAGRKPVTFKPGEAELPAFEAMFTTMEVRGTPMLVDVKTCDIEHYNRMLGFDKPIDLTGNPAKVKTDEKLN